jgi:cytochrome c-type biogenesis protein CcmH/NrfF
MNRSASVVCLVAVLGLFLANAAVYSAAAADTSEEASEPVGVGEAAAPASAGSSWAYDLAGELMSPFCPGRTVASCPSPQATELIQWIALQEAAGATREEVIAMLVERHGEEILGAPPAKGITLWAYVFPVLGFAAFGAIAVRVLRRIVAPSAPAPASSASASAAPTETSPSGGRARPAGGRSDSDELARIIDAELAERA